MATCWGRRRVPARGHAGLGDRGVTRGALSMAPLLRQAPRDRSRDGRPGRARTVCAVVCLGGCPVVRGRRRQLLMSRLFHLVQSPLWYTCYPQTHRHAVWCRSNRCPSRHRRWPGPRSRGLRVPGVPGPGCWAGVCQCRGARVPPGGKDSLVPHKLPGGACGDFVPPTVGTRAFWISDLVMTTGDGTAELLMGTASGSASCPVRRTAPSR